ncbi:L-serine ammonia-lyase [Helicobacter cetorum]|uniref:L-serine ammonia-lyase n=1 Tax=Helicobacter cetorum TaxID=138563 RepID=UPI000CF02050|nr:L-serine ammonia-lyase [Helicobacter cetorum]
MASFSILSIFKIGVGPSSSHTIGPMEAGARFCELLKDVLEQVERIQITLHGSLSLTGKGHLSDEAVLIGLHGICANSLDINTKKAILHSVLENKLLMLANKKAINFDYDKDLIFDDNRLSRHENALVLQAFNANKELLKEETYYSTGGGFVYTEKELDQSLEKDLCQKNIYDFNSAKELLELCQMHQKSIAEIVRLREIALGNHPDEVMAKIYQVMLECYHNGANSKEIYLPGRLQVTRLAPSIKIRLEKHPKNGNDPLALIDYISLYARAIAEENASGGKVVTAPTNGACAVVPSVLLYAKNHLFENLSQMAINDFLLTCSAIGYLYKKNASLSGAEAGCQAEIGVASSMAAGGLACLYQATMQQILIASEIAMEHHLGLTCDPVGGLVQIPCIERNVLGAIKAISASKLALEDEYKPKVSLDEVIATMRATGKDMDAKYKETSLGGLAKTIKC